MKKICLKRIFSVAISVALIAAVSIPSKALAAKTLTRQAIKDITVEDYKKMFPKYKEFLEKNPNAKLVGQTEKYFEFTPKSDIISSRKLYANAKEALQYYDVKEYTKEGYKAEIEKENSNSSGSIHTDSVGPQENGKKSWLKITMEVHQTSSRYFYAYNFSSWLQAPVFTGEDAIGIATNGPMIIGSGSKVSEYNYGTSDGSEDEYEHSTVQVTNNGAMATYNLADQVLYPKDYHNLMIGVPVEFTSSDTSLSGRIFGEYLHSQVKIGGIGFSSSGKPSVSIVGSTDSVEASVKVTAY